MLYYVYNEYLVDLSALVSLFVTKVRVFKQNKKKKKREKTEKIESKNVNWTLLVYFKNNVLRIIRED